MSDKAEGIRKLEEAWSQYKADVNRAKHHFLYPRAGRQFQTGKYEEAIHEARERYRVAATSIIGVA